MKTFFKVVDAKGRVLIPREIREAIGVRDGDIVQIGMYNDMLLLDKVNLHPISLPQKIKMELKTEVKKEEMKREHCKMVMETSMREGWSVDELLEQLSPFFMDEQTRE